MEQTHRQKILLSLPFWWIALTVVYIPLTLLIPTESPARPLEYLGLFVPTGLIVLTYSGYALNGYGSSLWPILLVFPFVIFVVFGGEYFLRKWHLSPLKKFLFVILILFLLTMAVDLMGYIALTELAKNSTY